MNHAIIRNLIGKILILVAILMILPVIVSIIYTIKGEDNINDIISFLVPMVSMLLVGGLLNIKKAKDTSMKAKEGFVIVALSWIVMSLFGCLPFIISGKIPNFFDAFFEIASGFTTTGSSILDDVSIETMGHSILFWRSFSHWIGGMGILVFILAIIPESKDGSAVHILRAESPGPTVDKIATKTRVTTRILYIIYIVLTVTEILFLFLGPDKKMDFFHSVIYSFGTAGTGGFGIDNFNGEAVGFGQYTHYTQYVVSIFMLIFSVNFTIYYLILIGKFKDVLRNEEFRWFFIIVIIAIGLLMLNIYKLYNSFEETFRYSLFTTATIISTTGYANIDHTLWPTTAKLIVCALMVIGGCAGSTAGGIKVTRLVILFKSSIKKIGKMLNPNKVEILMVDGKPVDDSTTEAVQSYFIIYVLIFMICGLVVSTGTNHGEEIDMVTAISASLTCINNVGPGLTQIIGPVGSFSGFTWYAKLLLSLEMIAGRLELFPVIILFNPKTWLRS